MPDQRFILIEPGAQRAVERACAELIAAGPTRLVLCHRFDDPRPGTVCAAEVASEQDAQAAVLAALAGAHLVIAATAARDVIDMLCEDLRRLGTLDHRVEGGGNEGPELSASERALLERLLAGDSLGEAAAALHLSRRTADRRLASARRALGASSTAEALGSYLSVR